GLQQLFLSDWYYVSEELINDMKYYPAMASPTGGGALMQITMSVPFGRWANFQMAYNQIIQMAQKQILIQTPYFMPTETILESLQTAAMRGVHVEIMVPLKPGGFWMTWANESYYGDVLKAGVEIYAYCPGMLHAKMMVVDDVFCSVGSVNMDFRSLNDTFEDSAFIYDAALTQQVKKLFQQAKTDCKLIDLDLWNGRNYRRRVLESFVRIFSPLF
ncbi:MAG: phospholipase D-like domain-containing protein, partial [Bacteroidaceae bacterium]|nr:phospholipase D-like domain-containing protein [Bacteroidaceae bacterium]